MHRDWTYKVDSQRDAFIGSVKEFVTWLPLRSESLIRLQSVHVTSRIACMLKKEVPGISLERGLPGEGKRVSVMGVTYVKASTSMVVVSQ